MSTLPAFDAVLAERQPAFDQGSAIEAAAATFAVRAASARSLGSERDQTFMLHGDDGQSLAILKISNPAEHAATLDMEALAVLHAARVDPSLALALPRAVPGAGPTRADGRLDPAAYRATTERDGATHFVRMYDVLPGRPRPDPRALDDAALIDWGATTARLGLALRGFFHPAAGRTMLWDIQHAPLTRGFLASIRNAEQRDLVRRVLDRYDEAVAPAWPALRAQVVHTDLDPGNTLVDERGRIVGIVDFGDASHTALLADVAAPLSSLPAGRPADELFRVGRLILDGYQRHVPLEPLELRLLGELVATRAAVTIAIPSWRSAQGLDDTNGIEEESVESADVIETILATGWDEVARRYGADVLRTTTAAGADLRARRESTMGPALEPLSYETPIHLASASGVWLVDVEGRRYLDAYNNVPVVGHAHPRVTEAIARQARRLNTNLRYLHPLAIELAERLIASMPAGSGLDTVFYVNSGSEANDLAWRLATAATGGTGGLCTTNAYHGISAAITPLTPESWLREDPSSNVETWSPADPDGIAGAAARLGERGIRPALAILDGLLTSDGYPTVPPETARGWLAQAHAAGALWTADEVQGGHGRTGESMWSFARLGLVPDIVTLGKPMGNGHPVGAVITRREIAAQFAEETVFFSTFGGNPVSMAAGLAVLDVIDDERVLERAMAAGAALRAAFVAASTGDERIVEVRGVGLAVGVECVDGATASAIKEALRERGVLIGTAGSRGETLKIRPPLAFTLDEVPILVEAFAGALRDPTGRR